VVFENHDKLQPSLATSTTISTTTIAYSVKSSDLHKWCGTPRKKLYKEAILCFNYILY